jgi:excisionase family DNA binding protein
MPNDFESIFKEMLRVIVKEVVAETRADRSRETPSFHSNSKSQALLLNSRDAAEVLAISEPHLSRLTRSGTIPHVRVGKCLRYSVETLQNWVRQSGSIESPPSRTATTKQPVMPMVVEKVTPCLKDSIPTSTEEAVETSRCKNGTKANHHPG